MQLLLQTNDPVLLSYAQSVLSDADIEPLLFDSNMSIMEGSIGIFPRRLMVRDEDADLARQTLREAGLTAELAPMPKS
jgi:Putative prokaryotic signal transducing protein